jgi:uncharacterized protein (TIGR02996 family)
MNEEEAFQKQLDEHPDDFQTRLVFADWLEERGDPRAQGYRALGVLQAHAGHRRTVRPPKKRLLWFFWNRAERSNIWRSTRTTLASGLPSDWFELLPAANSKHPTAWRGYTKTRREAEDAAALAFSQLLPERRAELLAGKK